MEAENPRAALIALVERSGASYAALSRLIGRNAAYLQQFVTRGSPRRLAERDRRLLARYFGVSERRLGGDGPADAPAAVSVPRLDVAAAAGAGAWNEDDRAIGTLDLDPRLVARLGVRPGDLALIRASGRSMEPGISDGDELLVDRADRRVGSRGGIFVVRLDGALMVKRVARAAGGYRLVSDNPEFAPVEAPAEIVGRVVWLSRAMR